MISKTSRASITHIILASVAIAAAFPLTGCNGPTDTTVATIEQPVGEAAPKAPDPVTAPPAPAQVQTDGATVVTLPSGLTIIVKPMRAAPVVTVKGYVRAGSMNEGKWLGCGLSHLLEHLVADDATHDGSGASTDKKKKPSNRVTQIGGQANAYTNIGHTCYYISATSNKTGECIDLVADWLARPKFTEQDFDREHGVVQRELEKGKDEPNRQMWYAHSRNVFGTHPAAVPTIGYPAPLAAVTWTELKAYHTRMYVPQNIIFVVVGDVDVAKVLDRTRKAFEGFKPGRQPDLSLPRVRAFSGIRRVTREHKSLKEASESLSFQSIDLLHEDLYALDLLAYVLGSGRSSRLHRSLMREQKLVTSISCSSWTPDWGKGVFTVRFRSQPDKADQAEAAVLAELRRIVADGVGKGELDRAKRQKTADHVYSQQTANSVASTLASDMLSTGDVSFSKNYTARIQAVTPEQVQAAAQKYLTFNRYAVTRLVPKLDDAKAAGSAKTSKQKKQFFQLSNGLRVILQPAGAGLVSMAYVAQGGVLAETKETNGLGTLMTALSTRGTKSYTAKQIDEFFATAGGSISGQSGNNSFYWQATVLSDSFDKALDIFAEVINSPSMDTKELEILRPSILAAIKRTDEHWQSQLMKFFRAKFFTDSPYGMQTAGSEVVVAKATPADIVTFAKPSQPGAKTSNVLAIYGRFDAAELRAKLEDLFGRSTPVFAPPKLTSLKPRTVAPEGELHLLKTAKKQAAIIVAAPSTKLDSEDRFAITVLDTIISGYRLPSGWMHEELRGKQLVYVVHSYNFAGLAPGAFMTYAACQPDKAPQVIDIIKKNLRRASTYKPTQDEIDLAVNTILTADILGNQKLSDLAISSALDELYGLGHDFRTKLAEKYRAVTPEDVLRVGGKYLSGGYVVTVTTPKPELLEAPGKE